MVLHLRDGMHAWKEGIKIVVHRWVAFCILVFSTHLIDNDICLPQRLSFALHTRLISAGYSTLPERSYGNYRVQA
jgi:hypothetical protein